MRAAGDATGVHVVLQVCVDGVCVGPIFPSERRERGRRQAGDTRPVLGAQRARVVTRLPGLRARTAHHERRQRLHTNAQRPRQTGLRCASAALAARSATRIVDTIRYNVRK